MKFAFSLTRPRRLARPRTSPFHGGNTGSNPVGDAKSFQQLTAFLFLYIGTKKAQIASSRRLHFIEEAVFSH